MCPPFETADSGAVAAQGVVGSPTENGFQGLHLVVGVYCRPLINNPPLLRALILGSLL